jgi:hypothetical protein
LVAADLEVERREDWRGETSFADVGALVYCLRAVPWTVPDFSVDRFQHNSAISRHARSGMGGSPSDKVHF